VRTRSFETTASEKEKEKEKERKRERERSREREVWAERRRCYNNFHERASPKQNRSKHQGSAPTSCVKETSSAMVELVRADEKRKQDKERGLKGKGVSCCRMGASAEQDCCVSGCLSCTQLSHRQSADDNAAGNFLRIFQRCSSPQPKGSGTPMQPWACISPDRENMVNFSHIDYCVGFCAVVRIVPWLLSENKKRGNQTGLC